MTTTQFDPERDVLLPYQRRVMDEVMSHNVTVIEKSRRIGISWVLSWLAVTVAAAQANAGGMDVFYMGYEKNMTRQFIDDCAKHAKIISGISPEIEEDTWVDPKNPDRTINVFLIRFASGFEIVALPSIARAFRSKQGLVILDEAAFVDDLEAMLTAALALRIWGARIVILSTHLGDTNPFNELIQECRSGRKSYHVMRLTFDEAVEEGLFHKICAKNGREWSQEAQDEWYAEIMEEFGSKADQELHVIPDASTGSAIPLAWIEARTTPVPVVRWSCTNDFTLLPEHVRYADAQRFCETDLLPLLEQLDPKTPHALGEDFARNGDLTDLWPLALERSLLRRTPFLVELKNVPFEQQKQILWFVLDRLPMLRAVKLDGRGNGQWLGEVTMQRYGAIVEVVMLSEAWYRENMPAFKTAFEDGLITVPADRDVQDDLRSLQMVRGVIRVPEGRSTGRDGNKRHGDAAVAGALAYAASRADPEVYEYTAVPDPIRNMGGRPDYSGADTPDARNRLEDYGAQSDNFGMRGGVAL